MTTLGVSDPQTVQQRDAIEFPHPGMAQAGPRAGSKTITVILWSGLALQIGSLVYYAWYLCTDGYLPAPFIFNKLDTFMDLYNPLWWSGEEGKYGEWRSIYPPLNYVILE